MSTPSRRHTHLQRAYKIFESMNPQLLSARQLAALMCTWPNIAYKYIERLKRANCIQEKGGSGKVPLYGLAENAAMPAGDSRGRKRKREPACIDAGAEHLVVGTGQ
jgi:hypothetical protein